MSPARPDGPDGARTVRAVRPVPATGILGTVTDPRALAGQQLALAYLRLLESGDGEAADRLVAGIDDRAALVFAGAALTTLARRHGRALSPSERASVGARQTRLQQLRDTGRGSVEGLRRWVAACGAEAVVVLGRSLPDAADRLALLDG